MELSAITAWPGKSDRQTPPKLFPAAWHMLDVAACAEVLMQRNATLRALPEAVQQGLLLLILLHDIGKFSTSFRNMLENGSRQSFRHWQLSHLYFCDKKAGFRDLQNIVLKQLQCSLPVLQRLSPAVSGHHGIPPDNDQPTAKRRELSEKARKAACAFTSMTAQLFPKASLAGVGGKQADCLSWLLSGLAIQADWLGSNTRWFPLERQYASLSAAWEDARHRAGIAVAEAGLERKEPAPFTDAATLCGFSDLRPMQQAAAETALPDGPVMILVEDATGAGKTEAALILAQRLMAAGKANGLFFALPTMATSNAMYDRLATVVPKLFAEDGGPPSFVLAHGRRDLHPTFRQAVSGTASLSDTPTCSAWLADDRRLALLAEIGVGTIDQALLAVLPVRFNTLRLWGLAGKVLIVDEAHSYDPYMESELAALLEFHAMLGGSAIVMTATLPEPMRDRFSRAFLRGLGCPGHDQEVPAAHSYPCLSITAAGTGKRPITSKAIDPAPATCRTLHINRLDSTAAAIDLLQKATAAGAACVWIRNAVDEAIAAAEQLRALGIETDLLHARFTMWDRLRIEENAKSRFGKNGSARAGRVLIATQVIEVSLDLDFDVMISDLAPIGALLQRAGRLWRHMEERPPETRPAIAAVKRGEPVLHVLSPDPERVEGENWLHETLGRGAWVYDTAEQWRTAKTIFTAGRIAMPTDLRNVIRAVHGEDRIEVPAPLERLALQAEGSRHAESAHGWNNTLNPEGGYAQNLNQAGFKDTIFPTRLGREQITLMLMRRDEDGLIPWAQAQDQDLQNDPVRAEALSEVQMSKCRFERLDEKPDQALPEIQALVKGWPAWKCKQVRIAIVDDDGTICEGLQYDAISGLLISSPPTRG